MELYPETFDVQGMIRDLASTIQPLVDKNSNQLAVEVAPDVGPMYSDLTKIRQMMLNLLSNACKFTKAGVIRIRVRQEMADGRAWMIFQVADSGIGMEQDRVSKVFEAFTQADASTTRKYGGTGLGLTITRKFCEMMGGDINVESTIGIGTTFTIRLPAGVAGENRMSGNPPGDPLQALAKALTPDDIRPECKAVGSVLVIDDDPAAQGLMNAYLTRAGYSVTSGIGRHGGTATGAQAQAGHHYTRCDDAACGWLERTVVPEGGYRPVRHSRGRDQHGGEPDYGVLTGGRALYGETGESRSSDFCVAGICAWNSPRGVTLGRRNCLPHLGFTHL